MEYEYCKCKGCGIKLNPDTTGLHISGDGYLCDNCNKKPMPSIDVIKDLKACMFPEITYQSVYYGEDVYADVYVDGRRRSPGYSFIGADESWEIGSWYHVSLSNRNYVDNMEGW